jgi:hypothetical protein
MAGEKSNRKIVKFVISLMKLAVFLVAYRVSDGEAFVMHVFFRLFFFTNHEYLGQV